VGNSGRRSARGAGIIDEKKEGSKLLLIHLCECTGLKGCQVGRAGGKCQKDQNGQFNLDVD